MNLKNYIFLTGDFEDDDEINRVPGQQSENDKNENELADDEEEIDEELDGEIVTVDDLVRLKQIDKQVEEEYDDDDDDDDDDYDGIVTFE